MIYLAAPYSHPQPEVVSGRVLEVERVLANLTSKGKHAFSPLLMHHCWDKGYDFPSDFGFWKELCISHLKACTEMIVLCLEGWEDSEGINAEIKYCSQNGIPVSFREPSDFT